MFRVSENGWITKELFYEWFKMFAEMIPRAIGAGWTWLTYHIDVIEYAQSKEIHLLCLPSHTSHIRITALGCRGFQIVQILFLQGMPSVHGQEPRTRHN